VSSTLRLFIAEKPSQAKDIARVLGVTQRATGHYASQNVIVTWCIGHLLESAPPEAYGEQYKRWSIEQLPIVPERWKLNVKASTGSQFKVVKGLLSGAAEVVIATDADREGEMIAREVLEFCGYSGPVQRLWLSSLDDSSIRKALSALRVGSETLPLYHAALGRACADWLVGMNLSRLFTLLGRKAGYSGVLSVGRVQTPTLQLVVHRDREIANFVPVPYFAIEIQLSVKGQNFVAQWLPPEGTTDSGGRCLKQEVAWAAAEALRNTQIATVASLETEHIRDPPPLPFDLSTLQSLCSRRLGLDVQETLNIAQALYERHKATTYPRSDCRYLPTSMLGDVDTVLDAVLAAEPGLRSVFDKLDRKQRSRAWDDTKITAHHGIIPTPEPPRLGVMSPTERAVYELIRAHYLAQFLPHYEYDRTTAVLASADQKLRARGQQVRTMGWRIVLREADSGDDEDVELRQVLPGLNVGSRCDVIGVHQKDLKTAPPNHYSQGELIGAMKSVARLVTDPRLKQKLKETTGIGTEATRAGIIEGLIGRGYLIKQGRRAIRASPAAFTLIDVIPRSITDPGTTALWEQSLDLIAARQMTVQEFVSRQSAWVSELIRQNKDLTLSIQQTSVQQLAQSPGDARRSRRRRAARTK
jgi:DNA topoisomerase III